MRQIAFVLAIICAGCATSPSEMKQLQSSALAINLRVATIVTPGVGKTVPASKAQQDAVYDCEWAFINGLRGDYSMVAFPEMTFGQAYSEGNPAAVHIVTAATEVCLRAREGRVGDAHTDVHGIHVIAVPLAQ